MKYLLAILTIAIGLNQSVKPIVAVVDFENQTPNVSNSQLAMVRDQIEIALVQSAKYTMISPNDRDKVLKELKFQNTSGCVEQSCIIELGNALGAQMLVSGSLSQIGDIFILTAKMYSVETGKIYKSATYNKAKALQDVVLQGTISVVAQLTGKLQMISQYEPEIIEPQQNVGYLTVNTQPAGIDIKIDGQNTHLQTPMINFELSTGTHTVILTSDKYERVAQAVIIEPKKTKEIEIILVEKQGEVNFVTDPKGAEVFVDGAYKGTTPMQLTIKLSNYDIKLEKEFYKDISYKLTVDGDLVESYKKMGPKLVNVTLLTKPSNAKAKLTINGKSKGVVGENGMDLELLPNIYDIKLTADNFETEQTTITITPDNYFEKTFNLQKKKSVIRNSKDNNYNGKTGTMTDQDGNIYETVQIGDQIWTTTNLKVTHYRNGDAIPTGLSDSQWTTTNAGAYSVYDNNESNADTYGYLYNWYAVDDTRNIAPEGWHIPTDEEWMELEMVLGMSESEANSTGWRGTDEGGKLKETGTSHWNSPNTGATNESGFTALPGGYRDIASGGYGHMGDGGCFWSSTVFGVYGAWGRVLGCSNSEVLRYGYHKRPGFAIRLLRD